MLADYDILMTELDEDTCWRMLAGECFGRIGFLDGEDVVILPVNAGVHRRRILFRTEEGATLATKDGGAKVAFEADHADRIAEAGWSVVVRGRLWDVTGSPEASTFSEFSVHPWAPPPRDRWMMIEPTLVTGRRIERHRRVGSAESVPYMPPD